MNLAKTNVLLVAVSTSIAALLMTFTTAPANGQAPTYSIISTLDGYSQPGSLIQDENGDLYGITNLGGNAACYGGCGAVFKVDPSSGAFTVLLNFDQIDGEYPVGGLTRDRQGNLYGATGIGGKYMQGTVFGLNPAGEEAPLYSFSENQNGYRPFAGLVGDPDRNLYGTTAWGGADGQGCQAGCGVVFEISSTGVYKVLHSFSGSPNDGGNSYSQLLRDSSGNLFGTTIFGGSSNNGIVFEVAPDGTETVLHSFSGTDGSQPSSSLIEDAAGNLYGVTSTGGTGGHGVVFKLNSSGALTVLYSFTGKKDGGQPYGQLFREPKSGTLFGAAFSGGLNYESCLGAGCGVVFSVSPSGEETVIHSFTGKSNGSGPGEGLIGRTQEQGGLDLFGTTETNAIFKLSIPPNAE